MAQSGALSLSLWFFFSNSRETSSENLASGSHHPRHSPVQHIQPWETRSCQWYAFPPAARGRHVNVMILLGGSRRGDSEDQRRKIRKNGDIGEPARHERAN